METDRKKAKHVSPALAAAVLIPAIAALAVAIYLQLTHGNDAIHHSDDWICTSNLHQIGLGITLYQQDHGQRYPDTFEQLYVYLNGKMTPAVFVCAKSTDTPASGATVAETAKNIMAGGHCSFVYLGKGMTDKTPVNAVVAYDPPTNHEGRMAVLFADGSAQFLDEPATKALMAKLKSPSTQPVTWP